MKNTKTGNLEICDLLCGGFAHDDIRNKRIQLDLKHERLIEDLISIHYTVVNDKYIEIESKKQIKKRIGRSTDEGDAFVYCNFMRFLKSRVRDIVRVL